MSISSSIQHIMEEFSAGIARVRSSADIDSLRVRFLGRKGPIQRLMQELKALPSEERPLAGKEINELKKSVQNALDLLNEKLQTEETTHRLEKEFLDVTLPGRRRFCGGKHVVMQTLDRVIDIFVGMGFSVQYGPDIESDYYNFGGLNFTEDHPARDMQDTFYIDQEHLLRTHTSNTQVRVMESNQPPIRAIAPGKCFRNEDITARSHVFFHQVEGFYIDHDVSFADLLTTLDLFLKKLFSDDVKVRFRPSYFPFVEPGMEVDVHCYNCNGQGCRVCKHTGWLEILGAGMIHPEVLKNGGIDSEEFTGYAWGMGIERLVMLKHGINDIRYFTENNMQFLTQFT
ncbi:phenylalanine--tRNA ligase subunit alpha [Simkania negevensis]|uniref:Phenylalanine--tRNA ligase alpha subunit n=1 Tax=Simkania negevensis TaxID=83561 RepID=A0ABS3AR81_9BACT|nr:phenylalanine--tRNA ligase subunit alpha [Simkania negevensis]